MSEVDGDWVGSGTALAGHGRLDIIDRAAPAAAREWRMETARAG